MLEILHRIGYLKDKNNKNKLVIDPIASKVVKFIYNKYLEEPSINNLAVILTERGIKTPSEYKNINCKKTLTYTSWKPKTIKEILTSQVYIGHMVQNKFRKINYKSKKVVRVPKDEWVTVYNTHSPIIDEKTFNQVQLLIDKSSYTRERKNDRNFLLKGLVCCKECGRKLEIVIRTRKKQERNLRCPTYSRYPKLKLCESHYIKESTINKIVLDNIRDIALKYLDKQELMDLAQKASFKDNVLSDIELEVNDLTNENNTINSNIDNLYLDKLNGILSKEDFLRISNPIIKRRKEIERRLKTLNEQKLNYMENRAQINLEELIEEFLNVEKPTKLLLSQLIDKVQVTKDKKIIINYRFKELENI